MIREHPTNPNVLFVARTSASMSRPTEAQDGGGARRQPALDTGIGPPIPPGRSRAGDLDLRSRMYAMDVAAIGERFAAAGPRTGLPARRRAAGLKTGYPAVIRDDPDRLSDDDRWIEIRRLVGRMRRPGPCPRCSRGPGEVRLVLTIAPVRLRLCRRSTRSGGRRMTCRSRARRGPFLAGIDRVTQKRASADADQGAGNPVVGFFDWLRRDPKKQQEGHHTLHSSRWRRPPRCPPGTQSVRSRARL